MLAIVLILSATSVAAEPRVGTEPDRVGQIIVIGNETTPHEKILDLLHLSPGQELPASSDLKKAEDRLRKRFYARLDLTDGKRLHIQVLASDSSYRDLLIHFPEKPVQK